MIAQLDSSYQWNLLNKNGNVANKLVGVIKNGKTVTPDMMPSAMLKIKNRIKSVITSKVLDAIDKGEIMMVYEEGGKVPIYMPFTLIRKDNVPNSCVAIVFLNVCDASMSGDEVIVDERKLKVSLEAAYFALKMFYMGDSPRIRTAEFIRSSSRVHSSILTECLNRKHSIKLDPDVYNGIIYMDTKYYIQTVLGATTIKEDALQSYCLYNCKNANLSILNKIDDMFEQKDLTNISTLLTKMTEVDVFAKRLKNLTVSNFIESYINMYNASMLLSLELLPYFVYNIIAVNESTFINNYGMLKNIVGQDGKKIYASLVTTLSD